MVRRVFRAYCPALAGWVIFVVGAFFVGGVNETVWANHIVSNTNNDESEDRRKLHEEREKVDPEMVRNYRSKTTQQLIDGLRSGEIASADDMKALIVAAHDKSATESLCVAEEALIQTQKRHSLTKAKKDPAIPLFRDAGYLREEMEAAESGGLARCILADAVLKSLDGKNAEDAYAEILVRYSRAWSARCDIRRNSLAESHLEALDVVLHRMLSANIEVIPSGVKAALEDPKRSDTSDFNWAVWKGFLYALREMKERYGKDLPKGPRTPLRYGFDSREQSTSKYFVLSKAVNIYSPLPPEKYTFFQDIRGALARSKDKEMPTQVDVSALKDLIKNLNPADPEIDTDQLLEAILLTKDVNRSTGGILVEAELHRRKSGATPQQKMRIIYDMWKEWGLTKGTYSVLDLRDMIQRSHNELRVYIYQNYLSKMYSENYEDCVAWLRELLKDLSEPPGPQDKLFLWAPYYRLWEGLMPAGERLRILDEIDKIMPDVPGAHLPDGRPLWRS